MTGGVAGGGGGGAGGVGGDQAIGVRDLEGEM